MIDQEGDEMSSLAPGEATRRIREKYGIKGEGPIRLGTDESVQLFERQIFRAEKVSKLVPPGNEGGPDKKSPLNTGRRVGSSFPDHDIIQGGYNKS